MSQRTLSNPFFALVDEAGQVGTRDFARLVDIVEAFEPRELELYKVPVNRRKMVKKPVLLNLPTPLPLATSILLRTIAAIVRAKIIILAESKKNM